MALVLVSVPTTGYVNKQVVYGLLQMKDDKRHQLKFTMPNHSPFENNLHHIINEFMDGDYEFWLTIDYDNPPLRNPLDIVELDLDIVGLPTPIWRGDIAKPGESPYMWNVFSAHKDEYIEYKATGGIHSVDAIGTGCVLFSRRVFENPEMRKGVFKRTYNEDGTVLKGNDLSFCERAREQGFTVWAHFDYPCTHYHDIDMVNMIKSFAAMKNKEKRIIK